MEYFLAVSDKQLGLCLRTVIRGGVRAIIETVRNSKKARLNSMSQRVRTKALLREL